MSVISFSGTVVGEEKRETYTHTKMTDIVRRLVENTKIGHPIRTSDNMNISKSGCGQSND